MCYRYTNPLYPLGERSYYTQSFGNVKDNFWNFPDFFPAADLLPSKRNHTVLFRAERGGPIISMGNYLLLNLRDSRGIVRQHRANASAAG